MDMVHPDPFLGKEDNPAGESQTSPKVRKMKTSTSQIILTLAPSRFSRAAPVRTTNPTPTNKRATPYRAASNGAPFPFDNLGKNPRHALNSMMSNTFKDWNHVAGISHP